MKFKEIDFIFFCSCKFFPKSSNLASWFFVVFLVQSESSLRSNSTAAKYSLKAKRSEIINNLSSFYRKRVTGFCFDFSQVQNHTIKRYVQRGRNLLRASVYVRTHIQIRHSYRNMCCLWLCSTDQQDTECFVFITTIRLMPAPMFTQFETGLLR